MMMNFINNIDLTDFKTLLLLYVLVFVIILFRYALLSGSYYLLFRVVFKKKFADRVLAAKMPSSLQIKREIRLSVYSTFVFGLVGVALIMLWQKGYTKIYIDLYEYPLWYFPISIILFMVLHDTYYYWMHKWMHDFKWLRRYHLDHHKSVNTTVLTSFSFHPVESFFQAIILPILFIMIPLNIFAILIILLVMTFSAIINHAGVEIYPRNSFFKGFKKHVIGATHHDIHHRHAQKNFGLYFTFWDRWMNTEY